MKFRASNSNLIVACPGTLSLNTRLPRTQTEQMKKGLELHAAIEQVLKNRPIPGAGPLAEATPYIGAVIQAVHNIRGPAHIEEPMYLVLGRHKLKVISDLVFVDADNVLHVLDFKTGRLAVSAVENYQLVCGALAYMANHAWTGTMCHLRIIQPNWKDTEWTVTRAELENRYKNNLIYAGNHPYNFFTGRHCRYCNVRDNCEKLKEVIHLMAENVMTSAPANQDDNDALATELRELEILKKYIEGRYSALSELVTARLNNGVAVGNWVLKPGRKVTKFADDADVEAIVQRAEAAGVDPFKPAELMTAPQLIKQKVNLDGLITKVAQRPSLKYVEPAEAVKSFEV